MMDYHVSPGEVVLGKYKVERVLGTGGMGVVVAVRHLELGELFAMKFILPAMLTSEQALQRFLREARVAARLRSEHVARVHDFGRMGNGAPYMIMEYLQGNDLKALLAERGALPVAEAVALVLQACEALAEAHAAGIVHRDLKPANLFVTHRPDGAPCLKVLDFGISKHTGPEGVDLTSPGVMMGSPLYMAPEQMARTRAADARSDIWSVGVILYELLTGRAPFQSETLTEVISRVMHEEPIPPRTLRPEVPAALEAVILQCLHKQPEERFQRVQDLIGALRRAVEVPRKTRKTRKGMGIVTGAAAGLVFLGLGAWLGLRERPRPPLARPSGIVVEAAPIAPTAEPTPLPVPTSESSEEAKPSPAPTPRRKSTARVPAEPAPKPAASGPGAAPPREKRPPREFF